MSNIAVLTANKPMIIIPDSARENKVFWATRRLFNWLWNESFRTNSNYQKCLDCPG